MNVVDLSPAIPLPPDPGGKAIKKDTGDTDLYTNSKTQLSAQPLQHTSVKTMENPSEKEGEGAREALYRTSGPPAPSATGSLNLATTETSWQREGKQPMVDERTEAERAPLIVSLAKARGLAGPRLVAVGVFLSVFLIPTKQLINYMRNVWEIRGTMEMHQLADKRFVLEFSERRDFEHVTKGGPWRYQGDAVLIRELEDKEDPNLA
jgi:hypothetical protein